MFQYISTRGRAPVLGFADAALTGLALDGGLYVPEAYPTLSGEDIANAAGQSYVETAWRVIAPFVSDDIPVHELMEMLRRAYKGFNHKEIAPLHQLEENHYVLELFHGPTLAFKDVALQFLGQVFDYLLKKRGERVTIVGATSGDTGSAAIEAFRDRENVDVFILHPKGRVSDVQRRQMTTVLSANVHNIALEGSFDDCQDIVKALFNDVLFRQEMKLSAINSINWARILAQTVYYVHAGARILQKHKKAPVFSVPTGNFGNVFAGYAAWLMGLPVERFIVATNRNDILHRFFTSGVMKAEGVIPTISPSMDIQISSNFERLLFGLLQRDGAKTERVMLHFRATGAFEVDDLLMGKVNKLFASGRLDDTQTSAVMKSVYEKTGYLLDPHTAVAVGVAQGYRCEHQDAVIVSLATAHPAKFPQAVWDATGVMPTLPERLADLHQREERYQGMPNDIGKIKDFIRGQVRT